MAEAGRKLSEHDDPRSRSILRIEQFRLADVMRILEMPKWQVLNYCKSKHVGPSIQDSSGPGTRRIFNRINLYQFAILSRLAGDGFDLRHDWTRLQTSLLFQPEGKRVMEKAKSHGILKAEAEMHVQEEDWLGRDGKDRVYVQHSLNILENPPLKPPPDNSKFIDRAKARGEKELQDDIADKLKRGGSVYVLEIDRLLDRVDANI